MNRFFSLGEKEDEEDDLETIELDNKVENLLKEIAKTSASAPDFLDQLNQLIERAQKSGQQIDQQKLWEFLKQAYKELPNIASIVANWTGSLSAYTTLRALKRQERISNHLLRSNNRLASATVALAIATFLLVVVSTAFRILP
jgi:hypothetical protein